MKNKFLSLLAASLMLGGASHVKAMEPNTQDDIEDSSIDNCNGMVVDIGLHAQLKKSRNVKGTITIYLLENCTKGSRFPDFHFSTKTQIEETPIPLFDKEESVDDYTARLQSAAFDLLLKHVNDTNTEGKLLLPNAKTLIWGTINVSGRQVADARINCINNAQR